MFTKRPDKDPASAELPRQTQGPAPARAPAQTGRASLIGEDLLVTGNLSCKGEIEIYGEVQGDVHAQRIVVGERAHVTGALLGDEVVVRGGVQGSIRGNRVTFQATCRVEGDIFHRSLSIEQGAFFEGKSRRTADPLAIPKSPNGLPPPA